jgi:hypothetical protein
MNENEQILKTMDELRKDICEMTEEFTIIKGLLIKTIQKQNKILGLKKFDI